MMVYLCMFCGRVSIGLVCWVGVFWSVCVFSNIVWVLVEFVFWGICLFVVCWDCCCWLGSDFMVWIFLDDSFCSLVVFCWWMVWFVCVLFLWVGWWLLVCRLVCWRMGWMLSCVVCNLCLCWVLLVCGCVVSVVWCVCCLCGWLFWCWSVCVFFLFFFWVLCLRMVGIVICSGGVVNGWVRLNWFWCWWSVGWGIVLVVGWDWWDWLCCWFGLVLWVFFLSWIIVCCVWCSCGLYDGNVGLLFFCVVCCFSLGSRVLDLYVWCVFVGWGFDIVVSWGYCWIVWLDCMVVGWVVLVSWWWGVCWGGLVCGIFVGLVGWYVVNRVVR